MTRAAEQRGVAQAGGKAGAPPSRRRRAIAGAQRAAVWPENHCAAPCDEPRPAQVARASLAA